MKPALATVVLKLRAGRWPSVVEYAELLRESGCTPDEARGPVVAYARAIGESSPAEDRFMEELRRFSLRPDAAI